MPELPEVERVRLTLAERIIGQAVVKVEIRRHDVIQAGWDRDTSFAELNAKRQQRLLLKSRIISAIDRQGKQLAIRSDKAIAPKGSSAHDADRSPCFCVHLCMTGRLLHKPKGQPINESHTHVVWLLASGDHLVFQDPRRFGGIWTFNTFADLQRMRWSRLGVDALRITPSQLRDRMQLTNRNLKATLLDQTVLAGLGNIYVDELLFRCGVHPMMPARRLDTSDVQHLVRRMRGLLKKAIDEEDYLSAARYRDRLREIKASLASTKSQDPAQPSS